MDEVTRFKRKARDAGLAGELFTDFATRSGLRYTNMKTGLVAEVVMAWMLGYFMRVGNTGLSVDISDYWDHERKADFRLIRFGKEALLQQKFNNNEDFLLPKDVRLIRVGADKSVFDGKFYVKPMRGSDALYEILSGAGLYSEEEIYDFFEDRPDFEGLVKGAWRYLKN